MPSRRPASTCEPSSGQRPRRARPGLAVVVRVVRSRSSGSSAAAPLASSVSARGSWRRATPTASRAAITATRWARYHVLPTAAAHHQTVPVANRTVVSARTISRIRQPAEHPPRDARRRSRPGRRAIASWSTVRPIQRDERQQHERGQGRERQQDLARRLSRGVEQRVDVLEVPVRRTVRRRRGPASRTKPSRAGTRPPARRNGCTGCSAAGLDHVYRASAANANSSPTTTAAKRPAPGWAATRGPSGALGYTPLHLQRCVGGSP